ncbi:MAG: hypothetical protein KDE46_14235, partial [Caldilineaceae bacterium]|nr:hypothetical protein [Caldilineaceae bacterium]
EQFAEAWDSSVLFADEANLRFINQDAVQLQIDLQEKAKKGQENIYKLFGIAVDEAVSAASSGISGGGISTGTIPTAASLIPANGNLTAIPTLGGMSTVLDVNAIQGQLDGLTIKPTIDLSALSDADLTGALDAFGQRVAEQVKTSIATEIGTTRFDGEVIAPIADGLLRAINTEFSTQGQRFRDEGEAVANLLKTSLASAIGTTTWDDTGIVAPVASGLLTAINTEFRGATDAIKREGSGIAITLRYGIAQAIATTEWSDSGIVGGIASGLITAINTDFRANNEAFQREGASIAAPILAGLSNSFGQSDNQAFDVAGGMITLLSTQFDEKQNMFYATGQTPAMNVISGFKTTLGGNEETNKGMIDPLLFGMTNAIRAREEDFRQRGATVAQAVLTGFTAQFDGEGFKNTLIAAGETMASYLEIGILAGISGIADAIGAQIVDDITNTVEEPTP